MKPEELERIGEIDRSERITRRYVADDGRLTLVDVDIDASPWGGPREAPVQHYIDQWRPRLYVSATPTRGTVDFYMSCGFEPLVTPDPELFALEPDDIHLDVRL